MAMPRIELSLENEKRIIEYIKLGYADWEIRRLFEKEKIFEKIGTLNIRNVRRNFKNSLSQEERTELARRINKRRMTYKNRDEIEKLKQGYTFDEILQSIGKTSTSNKAIFLKQMNIRMDKYIELGILTQNEIQLARIKRQRMSKNNEIEEDER